MAVIVKQNRPWDTTRIIEEISPITRKKGNKGENIGL